MGLDTQRPTVDEIDEMTPEEMLGWAHAAHGSRAAIITSFQNTGVVMIDMAHRLGHRLRVLTIDTLRLHQETYDLMDRIEERYGIAIERFRPDPDRVARMVQQHGEYLFFDSPEKQAYCCQIRKVEPNQRALETVDVWFTGLRRDQSEHRRNAPRATQIKAGERTILKLSPLADWTEENLAEYIRERDVPYNPLLDMGYASIGCVICTTPTLPGEEKRAGRWRWFNQLRNEHQKECGIHINGSGI